jgi:hypothetical protein
VRSASTRAVNQHNSPSPDDDLDRELSELLSTHHTAQELDIRLHVNACPHCLTIATLIGNLRRDIWTIHDQNRAA